MSYADANTPTDAGEGESGASAVAGSGRRILVFHYISRPPAVSEHEQDTDVFFRYADVPRLTERFVRNRRGSSLGYRRSATSYRLRR